MRFNISYEARQHGAIGIFSTVEGTVDAETPTQALEQFRAERPELEFRFPISITNEQGETIHSDPMYEVVDNGFNRDRYPDLIGQKFARPPAYAHVRRV